MQFTQRAGRLVLRRSILVIVAFIVIATPIGFTLRTPNVPIGTPERVVIDILGRPSSRLTRLVAGMPACSNASAEYCLMFRRPLSQVVIVYFDGKGKTICVVKAMSFIAH